LRICLAYDCLFPWSIGGAERWTRALAEALVAEGHELTYLTRVQWAPGEAPDLPGIQVVGVSGPDELYGPDGNRAIGPPLAFGAGVAWWLARHGREVDVVHTASFPYFSLLAAGLLRRRGGFRVVVDWHEVWSDDYWAEYLGPAGGRVGAAVQAACARVPQAAFCFSELHAARLRALSLRGPVEVLRGEFEGPAVRPQVTPADRPPHVVFAGRLIAEKQAPVVVEALALAAGRVPGLRGTIFGDGPQLDAVRARIAQLDAPVRAPGFVAAEELERALRGAACLVLPSRRAHGDRRHARELSVQASLERVVARYAERRA
jgi:glycosyltransferase involved in cell wall biosynthesis